MANPVFFIDGQEVTPPENWQGIRVLMTWDNSSVQANISSTEGFMFVLDAAKKISDYRLGGLNLSTNGFFQGLPVQIKITEGDTNVNAFDGFVDFTTGYKEITPKRS